MNVNFIFLGTFLPVSFKLNTDDKHIELLKPMVDVRLPQMVVMIQHSVAETIGVPVSKVYITRTELDIAEGTLSFVGGVEQRCFRWTVLYHKKGD